jgi:16S rRNA (cytosine1402-N4)-methyltransferase
LPENESHVPVLVAEVVELLEGRSIVVDATVGAGGHAEALLESGVEKVVGVDRDPAALELASSRLRRFGGRFRTVQERFSQLAEAVRSVGIGSVDGVLFDLGVSSMQLDTADRGFSYRADATLDMRMGGDGPTARDVVNSVSEEELARIVFEYGGERYARRIAAAIARARRREPIETTAQLAAIVAGAVPRRRSGPHPARRTFQAIRIEVNDELGELAASLPQAASLLESGGRIAVISYHSLEDRVVKRFMTGTASMAPITKKPVRPSAAEAGRNPRARSAKLRAGERLREEAA